ncbi:MAG: alpha-L-arabinofuranosidase C-terminal domain-containing protein [Chitinophagaceae bacterium]
MKKINHIVIAFYSVLIGTIVSGQTKIQVANNKPQQVINANIYGHFAEHLGHCIYNGIFIGDTLREVPNTEGIRNDIVAALRKLKVPILRWPGGCFADTYHWKDGIGPKSERPSMVNKWWGGVTEDNSFGTHDFLLLCQLLGAAPYLAGNTGSGTPQELADWVQYVNFDGKSPMGDLRRKNGHDSAWNVQYWGVGNEAWGCGGNMRPEYYADIYRRYSTFMTDYNPQKPLFKIASGANSADYHWTETLMKNIPLNMVNGIALHHYAVIEWNRKGPDQRFTEDQYFKTMRSSLFMDSLIARHSAVMDKYDPQKKVALVVDEWGGWYDVAPGTNPGFLYQQNTMRDAMIAATTLNIFNNHSDRVRLANLAQIVNVLQSVILTDKEKMVLTPTYHIMEMYNVHQNAKLIPTTFVSPTYVLNGQSLPAVSVSASIDDTQKIHVSMANIDAHKPQQIELDFAAANDYKKVSGRILTSDNLTNCNTFENPNKIQPATFNGAKLQNGKISLTIPPFSAVVLELTKN